MKRQSWFCVVAVLSVIMLGTALVPWRALQADPPKADAPVKPEALERTRKTVKMLDHIYKQAIVLITDKYVHDEDDFPAGSAAVVWFDSISKQGSHKVRLIDASGEPIDSANVAKDAFEKQGIAKLKKGADFVEQVVEKDGKQHLRALTPVPVVMQKCIMCHPNYEQAAKGEPIGAISYTIPIE